MLKFFSKDRSHLLLIGGLLLIHFNWILGLIVLCLGILLNLSWKNTFEKIYINKKR